ncbi:hypothetical protein C0J52_09244 [Blattella germanica]|nr:hypothetical protein C0J52_09244 [Blattella germanica]
MTSNPEHESSNELSVAPIENRRRVSIASDPPTVVDGRSLYHSDAHEPRRRVSVASEHVSSEGRRKSILVHSDSMSLHSHHSGNPHYVNHGFLHEGKLHLIRNSNENSGKPANGEGPIKKYSMTESLHEKIKLPVPPPEASEKSWWFMFCKRCHQEDPAPSWEPPLWQKLCPHPFCPTYRQFARILSLFLIGLLIWGVVYVILGDTAAPGGQLFGLAFLSIAAHFGGWLVTLTTMPALIGMLLVGILFQNVVSPAVVVPCLLRLRSKGYGVAKGIPTLIIAVSGIDDAASVAIFGIIHSIKFSSESLLLQIIQGPLSIIGGIGFGILWGVLSKYVPEKQDSNFSSFFQQPYAVPLRILMLLCGGLIAVLGSEGIGYGGAGPLACVAAAFVSVYFWTKQGWDIEDVSHLRERLLGKFMARYARMGFGG